MPRLVAAGLGLGAVIAPLADIVLARVPASTRVGVGVFNTGLQLGNSIGIAVIGVIFFGLLGSQSGPAASAVAPQLRSGVWPPGSRRLRRPDRGPVPRLPARPAGRVRPDGSPASCKPKAGPVSARPPRVLAGAGATASRHDFIASLIRTLWFQVGVFLVSFLLMLGLPRGAGRRDPAAAGNEAGLASAREGAVIG